MTVLTSSAALVFAQEARNNEGIIKLMKSGMSEELIAAMLDTAKPAGAPARPAS